MVFSSLLFIFLFFSLNLIIYLCVDKSRRNLVLLIFSLVFYAWSGPKFLILLVGETWISWFLAKLMQGEKSQSRRKLLMAAECVALLGLLGYYKYTTFLLGNFHALFGVPEVVPQIVLPIGISFYTFQLLSYVIDVYREEVEAQMEFGKLLLYSSLFYQCIAGPIVRYETVAEEIDERSVTSADIFAGIRRFSVGLAKKAILANSCAEAADSLLPAGAAALQGQSTVGLWLGMLFYMLQIYLDFSAYSDMAIGMGRMVGFHFLENFNYPYIAKSVQDFWRRWHISLSTFFRDYVYIPLGGSRCDTRTYIRNMAVVWCLTGIWHGASWNYLLWGVYYLGFLLLERFVIRDRIPRGLDHLYALAVVYFGWVIFRFENMGELGTALLGMIGIGTSGFTGLAATTVFLNNLFFLLFCLVAVTPLGKMVRKMFLRIGRGNQAVFLIVQAAEMVTPVLLLLFSTLSLIGASYNPFLYFRF